MVSPLLFLVGCARCGTTEPPHAEQISTPQTAEANRSLESSREAVAEAEPPLDPAERSEIRGAANQSLTDARRALVRMDRRIQTLRQRLAEGRVTPEVRGLVDSAVQIRDQLAQRIGTLQQAGVETWNEANLQVENAIDSFDETYFRAMQVLSRR